MDVGPATEPEVARLSLWALVHYRTRGQETSLFNLGQMPRRIDVVVELQLARYALLLREHCAPVLRGDFSWWLDACKYTLKYIQDDYRLKTGLELPANERFAMYVKSKENRCDPK